MRIYLHIGTHKTGSTSIQETCSNNRGWLEDSGIYYPSTGDKYHAHHELAWLLQRNDFENARGYLKKEISTAKDRHLGSILLSSEEFEFLQSKQRIAFFEPFGEVKVICFFRRQDDFLEAEYNQNVKMPSVRFPDDLFKFYMYHHMAARLNYQHFIKNWLDVYGDNNFIALSFDKAKAENNLLCSFFKSINHVHNMEQQTITNTSLPNRALIYIARFNKQKNLTTQEHVKLLDMLQKDLSVFSRETFIPMEYRSRLMEKCKQFNRFIIYENPDMEMLFSAGTHAQKKVIDFHDDFDPQYYKFLQDKLCNHQNG